MLDRLSSGAARLADRRLMAVSVAAWLSLAALLFVWSGRFSLTAVARACGRQAPDVRFAPGATDTRTFIAGCGDEGLTAYRDLQLVDLAYPLVAAAVLVTALALLLSRIAPLHAWLSFMPLVAAAGDYVENVAAWVLIADGTGRPAWATLTLQIASAIKVTASWASWLLVIALLAALAVTALTARRAAQRSSAKTSVLF